MQYDYDSWGTAPKTSGIMNEQKSVGLENIRVEISHEDGYPKGAVEYNLVKGLVDKLLFENFVNFTELRQDPINPYARASRADIYCVKVPRQNKFSVQEAVFKYNGINWSEDEIKLALRDYYPERFL